MVRINREITIGSIIQLVGMLIGFTVFIVTMRADLESLRSSVARMDTTVNGISIRLDSHIDRDKK